MKATDGSDIKFKKENVSCETQYGIPGYIFCTANGVRTDLTNRTYPFYDKRVCYSNPLKKYENQNSFACSSAIKFGILTDPQKYF